MPISPTERGKGKHNEDTLCWEGKWTELKSIEDTEVHYKELLWSLQCPQVQLRSLGGVFIPVAPSLKAGEIPMSLTTMFVHSMNR